MAKHCPFCFSTDIRLSRIRHGDFIRLVLLMYPVRCRECLGRSFVFLPLAPLYRQSTGADHAKKPQKA
jgi:hypothetical protein